MQRKFQQHEQNDERLIIIESMELISKKTRDMDGVLD